MSSASFWKPVAPVSWKWVHLQGPDSADFLQRVTTVHLGALEVGSGTLGFFLTAQGKIEAAFTLWRLSPDEFGMELDGGPRGENFQALRLALDRYHFSERIEIVDVSARTEIFSPVWVFPTNELAHAYRENSTQADPLGIRVQRHPNSRFGRPWLTLWGSPSALQQWGAEQGNATTWTELTLNRVQALSPWWGSEWNQDSNPLEAGSREGIAEQKGCYPGQEVIERIISIGSPAKRLVLAQGPHSHCVESADFSITSKATDTQGSLWALGWVRKILAVPGKQLGDFTLQQVSRYD